MDAFEQWELEEQLRHVARVLGPEYLRDRRAPEAAAPDSTKPWTDWFALVVGFAALALGGVLCTGELWGRGENLWKFGLAVALIGQAALAVGLWKPHAERSSGLGTPDVGRHS